MTSLRGASISLSSFMVVRNSSNLDPSVRSPQWMATSARLRGLSSGVNSIPCVSEMMRNRVLMLGKAVVSSVVSMTLSGGPLLHYDGALHFRRPLRLGGAALALGVQRWFFS